MDFKKSLKDVLVLLIICTVFGALLAGTNLLTKDRIAANEAGKANEAYNAVMPAGAKFDDSSNIDLSSYTLPATVVEAKKEATGLGYAIKLETSGYKNGMILIIGVSPEGTILGATCVSSNETNGDEKTFGDSFTGKDKDGALAVDLIAGSTLTTKAYRDAIVDAINAATILGGGSADIRTEEQILAENLAAALPAGEGAFTKMFMVEVVEGVEKVYTADNGAGYVLVVDGMFVGVGTDGVAIGVVDSTTTPVTEGIDTLKATAEAGVVIVSATGELENIDLTEEIKKSFMSIDNQAYAFVTKIQKTASGNYIVDLKTEGFGILGDDSGHIHGSGENIEIRVSLSADGKVIDAQTIYHSETDSYGGLQLKDGAYNAGFIGKNETEANGVEIEAGCTRTTVAFKYAVLLAFQTVTNLEGGATNE